MRVASLLPSATDILIALGAEADVVGVSHSCSGDWQDVPRLTSTWLDTGASSVDIDTQVRGATRPLYELDIARLEQLAPDVVISQSLCDVCAVPSGDVLDAVQTLNSKPELVDLAPNRLSDLPVCFAQVGAAIGRDAAAANLVRQWHRELAGYRDIHSARELRVAFLDWLDPPFAAGHWVPDMLEWLGVQSVLSPPGIPSRQVTWDDVQRAQPDLIIAACCGFGEERTRRELEGASQPIVCLDGHELFSRPSPALLPSMAILSATISQHLAGG